MNETLFCNISYEESYFFNAAFDEINFLCRDSKFIPHIATATFDLGPRHPLLSPANELLIKPDSSICQIVEFSDHAIFSLFSRKIERFHGAMAHCLNPAEEIFIPTIGFFAKPIATPRHELGGDEGGQSQANIFFCIPAEESIEVRLSNMEESGELEELWCDTASGSAFSIRLCDDLLTDLETAIRAARHDLTLLEAPFRFGYSTKKFPEPSFELFAA